MSIRVKYKQPFKKTWIFTSVIEPEQLLFVKALARSPAPKCNKFRNEQVKSLINPFIPKVF